jgi:methyl-accepting chemotaxis protein
VPELKSQVITERGRQLIGSIGEELPRLVEAEQEVRENCEAGKTTEAVGAMRDRAAPVASRIEKAIESEDVGLESDLVDHLDAAVEAARAGEAGMGFAVVADEVRNLAQRSAQASKDTAVLIEESIASSRSGKARLENVSGVIRSITINAKEVKTLVDAVSSGSQKQARGIEQISKAVAHMDQTTQSTAATAEEGASAAEELSAQARTMTQSVRQPRVLADGSHE